MFIQLTDTDGTQLWVNVEHVTAFFRHDSNKGTELKCLSDRMVIATEDPYTVLARIREQENQRARDYTRG